MERSASAEQAIITAIEFDFFCQDRIPIAAINTSRGDSQNRMQTP